MSAENMVIGNEEIVRQPKQHRIVKGALAPLMALAIAAGCSGGESNGGEAASSTTVAAADAAPESETTSTESAPATTEAPKGRTFASAAELGGVIGCTVEDVYTSAQLEEEMRGFDPDEAIAQGMDPATVEDIQGASEAIAESGFLESASCEVNGTFVNLTLYKEVVPEDFTVLTGGKEPTIVKGANYTAEVFDFAGTGATELQNSVANDISNLADGTVL